MRMLWLPIPGKGLAKSDHKELIALVERKLLWSKSLDPKFNSERVKRNSTITLCGKKRNLKEDSTLMEI
jgi:hypothetical protein